MTEERIEELKKWHIGSDEDIEALIRTVAAESRKEGREEVLKFFEEGEEDTIWRPYEITDAIARLKDQG